MKSNDPKFTNVVSCDVAMVKKAKRQAVGAKLKMMPPPLLIGLWCCCCLAGQTAAKKNLTPTAHVAVDMGSQFLKVSAEQSVRGATSTQRPRPAPPASAASQAHHRLLQHVCAAGGRR